MDNDLVVIIGMALLVVTLLQGGRVGFVTGLLSAIMIVGALRHPEIAAGKALGGTPEENLQATMLLVALIIFPGAIWVWLRTLFRRGR